jgi:hypothetical protein
LTAAACKQSNTGCSFLRVVLLPQRLQTANEPPVSIPCSHACMVVAYSSPVLTHLGMSLTAPPTCSLLEPGTQHCGYPALLPWLALLFPPLLLHCLHLWCALSNNPQCRPTQLSRVLTVALLPLLLGKLEAPLLPLRRLRPAAAELPPLLLLVLK